MVVVVKCDFEVGKVVAQGGPDWFARCCKLDATPTTVENTFVHCFFAAARQAVLALKDGAMPKPRPAKTKLEPQQAAVTAPAWPKFKPPLPVVDLEPALHPRTSHIVTIPSFFPKSLCRDYVSFLKTLPLQTTPGKPKRGEAVRVNDRFQIDDWGLARRLWEETGLREVVLGENFAHLWYVLRHSEEMDCWLILQGRRAGWAESEY